MSSVSCPDVKFDEDALTVVTPEHELLHQDIGREPRTAPESEPRTAPESEPRTAPESEPRTAPESEPRTAPESEPVAVQTAVQQTQTPLPQAAADTKGDFVLVPKEQLAMMRKFYVAVKNAYYNYALTDGDSKEVVRQLFEQTPEVLRATNKRGQSPIESALAQGKWAASAQLLELAGRRNPQALRHRTAEGGDAMMLAVSAGSEATVRQLVELGCGRDTCLHYDLKGRNALHLCALGSSSNIGTLQVLLAEFTNLLSSGQLKADCVTAALNTGDRDDGCTPLHYMARRNQDQMLQAVRDFSRDCLPHLDWDIRQSSGERRLTPLAMAAEADALGACQFLLQSGLAGIDVHEQLDMWLQVAPSDSARAILCQHCPLLHPLTDVSAENLRRLQDGLRERGLADEFLLRLRSHWPDLPHLPLVGPVLTACQNLSGSCRLVLWDILTSLDAGDLARLMEAQ